jgi:molecular chaperone GrpE (heat shock protein)
MRLAKSFTIEPEINEYVDETKGDRSASERVNELLRRAMLQEQYDRLEAEAEAFFSDTKADRDEAKAFQKASLRSFGRD